MPTRFRKGNFMEKYVIDGGKELFGTVEISGSKNSALAILFSALTVDGECIIENIPNISDVAVAIEILKYYGCDIEYVESNTVKINTSNIAYRPAPKHLTEKMRASSYLLGALLNRFGMCETVKSGGCDFGGRPIDFHIDALKKLGASVSSEAITAKKGLNGAFILFPKKTVGGTINTIIAATKANGITTIKNAACEPHVSNTASFLNKCGAEIYGAGSDTVTVIGKERLYGSRYKVDSDMIEAGTYITASIATSGKIICTNAPINELNAFIRVLENMGCIVTTKQDSISVLANKTASTYIRTAPYPGFPTDFQPQICALLGISKGRSYVTEAIFNKRFAYLEELKKFGITYTLENNTVIIDGIKRYHAASVNATDLRGGAAMIICALNANGKSEILSSSIIERGYPNITEKFTRLGADIKKERY